MDFAAAHPGADPLLALTEGFQSGFVACAVLAGVGLIVCIALLGRSRKTAPELEPAPVAE